MKDIHRVEDRHGRTMVGPDRGALDDDRKFDEGLRETKESVRVHTHTP